MVHVISQKGLFPQARRQQRPDEPWHLFWNDKSPRSTRGLLPLIRRQVQDAAEKGINWRSVIDCLRPVTQDIWRSLPLAEQKRFLRHARVYWDVHRHRVAPEIADILADMQSEGRVRLHRGAITRYSEDHGRAEIQYWDQESRSRKKLRVDRVINCTGSETDCRRIDESLITSLFVQGFARPDALFLGLEVDDDGALIDYKGVPSQVLYAIGPTRKGSLWETTTVPEIRVQAATMGEYLAGKFGRGSSRARGVLKTA